MRHQRFYYNLTIFFLMAGLSVPWLLSAQGIPTRFGGYNMANTQSIPRGFGNYNLSNSQNSPAALNDFRSKNIANDLCEGIGNNCQPSRFRSFLAAIGFVVVPVLTLMGLVCIALMVYGGYFLMLARNKDQAGERGKIVIRRAIMGLMVVCMLYLLWLMVVYFL